MASAKLERTNTPIMRVLDGGGEAVSGEDVVAEVGEIIDRLLPSVPLDDPYRPALLSLGLVAAGPLRRRSEQHGNSGGGD